MKLLASLLVFYPLIIPVWQKGPILSRNSMVQEHQSFIATSELKFQIEKFRQIKDPGIKSRMLFEWAKSNNPDLVPMLLNLLEDEEDDNIKSDIITNLFVMRHIKKCGNSAKFTEMMLSQNNTIRAYSTALYLDNNGNCDKVIYALKNEDSSFVISIISEILKENAERCSTSALTTLLSATNPAVRAAGAELLTQKKDNPDNITELFNICRDKNVSVRAALAGGIASRSSGGIKLLTILSKDTFSTVRSFAASAVPRKEIFPVCMALASDSSWDVRCIAARSMGGIKTDKSAFELLKMLSDLVPAVRTAAERAIIALNPDKSVLQKIGEEALPVKISRPYAITILGELKEMHFASQIASYLESTTDNDIILRVIEALDNMNYRKAEGVVRAKAIYNDDKIRYAVVHALGTFAKKESFDTLIACTKSESGNKSHVFSDKSVSVMLEAIISMGRIGDPYFIQCLNDILLDIPKFSPDVRSAASWSLARINKPSSVTVKQLEKIALTRVVPSKVGPGFDSDLSRISAILALVDMGKNSPEIRASASDILKKFNPPPGTISLGNITTPLLKEWSRQVSLYMKGEKCIKPSPLPVDLPALTVKHYSKNAL